MALGPITGLPGMPSPTAGQTPANSMPGLIQGLGQIDAAIQQKKEKAKADAQAQLPLLVQMAKAQPGNAAVQNSLGAALKTLGLPIPTQAPQSGSEGAPGGAISAPGSPPAPSPAQTPPMGMQAPASAGQAPTPMVQPQAPNLQSPAALPQVQAPAQNTRNAAAWLQRMSGHGVPGQQPQPGQQGQPMQGQQPAQVAPQNQIDINALMPNVPPTDKEIEYIKSLPAGADRVAAAKSMNKNFDPFLLNESKQELVPGSAGWVAINREYDAENTKIAAGTETAAGYNKWLKAKRHNLELAGIDTTSLEADPDTINQLGAKTRAQIADLEAHGVHFKNEDKIALMRATSTSELQAAQEKLISARVKALPLEDAHKWAYQEQMSNIAQRRVSGYIQNIDRLAQQAQSGAKVGGQMLRLASLYDGNAKELDNQIDRESNFLTGQIQNGLDPESPDAQKIQKHIADLQAAQSDAKAKTDAVLAQYTGPGALNSDVHNSGAPLTSHFAPKIDMSKAEAKYKDKAGQDVGKFGNKYYYADGREYKP